MKRGLPVEVVAAVVGAILTGIVSLVIGFFTGRSTTVLNNVVALPAATVTTVSGPTVTTTVTAQPRASRVSTQAAVSTSAPRPTASAITRQSYFAQAAQFVDDNSAGQITDGSQDGSLATLHGRVRPHSLQEESTCESSESGDYYADYSIPNSYSLMSGTLGIDDQSVGDGPVQWRIYLNQAATPATRGTVRAGQLVQLKLGVRGVYRVRLWINDAHAPAVSCGDPGLSIFDWATLTLTE